MFSKEMFHNNSSTAKVLNKQNPDKPALKFVLTLKEVEELLKNGRKSVHVISNGVVFWFTDDYCMGVNDALPKTFVPSSTVIPCDVVPRSSLPDGYVKTAKDYINVFHYNEKFMESFDELINYLNKNYPDFAD